MKLPVIFAGNKNAREAFSEVIKDKVDLRIVDNLRPSLEAREPRPRQRSHPRALPPARHAAGAGL